MLKKRVSIQCLGVHHFAVHDSGLGKMLPNGDGVHVVQIVEFLLGVESVGLDELGDPALDLGPGQVQFRTVHGDMERLVRSGVILRRQPLRRLLLTPVQFHVPDYGVFALNAAVPRLDCAVNIRLGDLPFERCLRPVAGKGSVAVRAELGFMRVDVPCRLMVDGGNHTDRMLSVQRRNAGHHRVLGIPELLQVEPQLMGRKAAYFDTSLTGYVAAGEMEVQKLCRRPRVLAVQLKEIAHLEQHDFVRVGFLDCVIFIDGSDAHTVLCLRFFPCRLSLRGQIAVLGYQRVNPPGDPGPGEGHFLGVRFSQRDSLGAVILPAMEVVGDGVVAAAGAVLGFEKVGLFLWAVFLLPEGIDTALAALEPAAAGQGGVDLILRDERRNLGHLRHVGTVVPARQGQVFQRPEHPVGTVVPVTHQRTVLLPGCRKRPQFCDYGLSAVRFRQQLLQVLRCVRVRATVASHERRHPALFTGLGIHVPTEMPEGFRRLSQRMAGGLGQLHLAGKAALRQQLPDPGGGVLPGEDLRGPGILCRCTPRDMQSVVSGPGG